MSCAEKEEYHYIAMATGGHNQQTVRIVTCSYEFQCKIIPAATLSGLP